MPKFIFAAAAVLLLVDWLSLPAYADLLFSAAVNGVTVIQCADGQGSTALCPGGDQNPAPGILQLQDNTFAGVTLNGSVSSAQGNPVSPGLLDILNTSSLNIINTTGATVHIQAAAGATDFTAPVSSFDASTSATAQQAIGSTLMTTFFDDALNRQGADTPTDGLGAPIASFFDTATLPADAFAHTATGPVNDLDPFSMTQLLDISLTAGGELVNRGSTEIKSAVPEPSSLLLLGLALVALWGSCRPWAREMRDPCRPLPNSEVPSEFPFLRISSSPCEWLLVYAGDERAGYAWCRLV